jgi:serine/threonine protein kinase
MVSPGSFFAGYRIERRLGSGGMGTVYLARNPDLPRSEALKILSAELSEDPEFRARFIHEADVAARLDHPNIVSVYQRGQYEGQLWIAMQFVDGVNADAAWRAGAMPPSRAIHVVNEVAKAIDYAHGRDVIHRDIKPANFLLSQAGEGDDRVLLGDFGIARAFGHSGLTATGSVMATLSYAAPEVLSGQRFDGRADLYSLGCTLFRLLTGQPPYASDMGAAAIIAGHLYQPPPTVSDRTPGISPAMDAVIATAMAKNPDHRYPSARALAHAATQALHEPSPDPRTRTWARPLPSSSSGVHLSPQLGEFSAPTGTTKQTSRRRSYLIGGAVAAAVVLAAAVTFAVTGTRANTPTAGTTSAAPTTAAPPPPPIIVASALGDLMLPAPQLSDIVGVPDMAPTVDLKTFDDESALMNGDDKHCAGAFQPAQLSAFFGTGAMGAHFQLLSGDNSHSTATQALVAYPSAQAAQKMVTDQTVQWNACAGKTITTHTDHDTTWQFGPVTNVDDIPVITYFLAGSPPSSGCQHAMAARRNVIVDAATCHGDAPNHAVTIVNALAAKVAAAP